MRSFSLSRKVILSLPIVFRTPEADCRTPSFRTITSRSRTPGLYLRAVQLLSTSSGVSFSMGVKIVSTLSIFRETFPSSEFFRVKRSFPSINSSTGRISPQMVLSTVLPGWVFGFSESRKVIPVRSSREIFMAVPSAFFTVSFLPSKFSIWPFISRISIVSTVPPVSTALVTNNITHITVSCF